MTTPRRIPPPSQGRAGGGPSPPRASEGRRESRAYRAGIYIILTLGTIPILLPLYWMLLASLKTRERLNVAHQDWLPRAAREFLTIEGRELPVSVFDEGEWSQTGVYGVKFPRDAIARIPRSNIARNIDHTYSFDDSGRRRRCVMPPAPFGLPGPVARRTVEHVILLDANQEAVVPAARLLENNVTRTLWQVFGLEIEVSTEPDPPPPTGTCRVRWTGDAPAFRLHPRAYHGGTTGVVDWSDRPLNAERLQPDMGGGFWMVRLVCPKGGAEVPFSELRREERRRTFLLDRGRPGDSESEPRPVGKGPGASEPVASAPGSDATLAAAHGDPVLGVQARGREVRVLDRNDPDGTARVELVGVPAVRFVPSGLLRFDGGAVYTAKILGQVVSIEPLSRPIPADPAALVDVRITGPLWVDYTLTRYENPVEPAWHNYAQAWNEQTFGLFTANTFFIAALVVLGTVLSCGLVGYGFARFRFPGRDLLFMLLLATMMIPAQITCIPTFVLFAKLGWIDSYKPLIVPQFLAASAFFVFLFRQFMLSIPIDVEDAARIDGCGPLGVWWLVMMPMCKPVIVTVALFSFVGVWNDFLSPLLYIHSAEKQTVALGLQHFKSAYQGADPQLIMAAAVMLIAPSLLLFLLAQRAFIREVVVSGVKG